MTYGHATRHSVPPDAESRLRQYLRMPAIKKRLADLAEGKIEASNKYDLPFLSGTTGKGSQWGLAYDRHLPRTIPLKNRKTGKVDSVDPRQFLQWHEAMERVLMDVVGLPYLRAHVFAELLEHKKIDEAGYDHAEYEKALKPYIDTSEAEQIVDPPPGLDKRPYMQDHDRSDNAKAIRKRLGVAA